MCLTYHKYTIFGQKSKESVVLTYICDKISKILLSVTNKSLNMETDLKLSSWYSSVWQCSAGIQTHDLLIVKQTWYQPCHHGSVLEYLIIKSFCHSHFLLALFVNTCLILFCSTGHFTLHLIFLLYS